MILTVKAHVRKVCPYRGENDEGTITLTFDIPEDDGPELHEMARELGGDTDWQISHEDYTRAVYDRYRIDGCVRAESTWFTAGLEVTAVVAGEPLFTSPTHPLREFVTP